jgi:hypothetical protein
MGKYSPHSWSQKGCTPFRTARVLSVIGKEKIVKDRLVTLVFGIGDFLFVFLGKDPVLLVQY